MHRQPQIAVGGAAFCSPSSFFHINDFGRYTQDAHVVEIHGMSGLLVLVSRRLWKAELDECSHETHASIISGTYHTYREMSDIIRRRGWLFDYLKNHQGRTFQQIKAAWRELNDGDDYGMSRGNFLKDRVAIETELGVTIFVDRKHQANRYYLQNILEHKVYTMRRIISAAQITGLKLDDLSKLQARIFMDDFPSENGMLSLMTQAMLKNRCVEINYKNIDTGIERYHKIEPYMLRTYRNRFYVIAPGFHWPDMVAYSFDRILSANITDEEFHMPPDFDGEKFFAPFYGVFLSTKDLEVTTVILRAFGNEARKQRGREHEP